MPHSSGGGSHSGGSHGGGSHHSYGSRSGNGEGPSSVISRKSFSGATRYRYTTRSGRAGYYYVSGTPEKAPLAFVIIFGLVILFGAFMILRNTARNGVFLPKKLDPASYSSGVCVSDKVGLGNTAELENAMQQFLDATGISPAVEIIYDGVDLGNLEAYAHGRYTALFRDEYHWLIVLSLPRDFRSAEHMEWRWEGIIGDSCYPAVSDGMERKFTNIIQNHLKKADGQTVTSQLAAAWAEMANRAPRLQLAPTSAVTGAIGLAVCVLLLRTLINTYVQPVRLENAVPDPEEPAADPFTQLAECECCGAEYDPGTEERCPGCGASIRKD